MPSNVRVRDLMTTSVKTLGRNEKVSVADAVMRNERIRYLPVIDEDGQLAGIICQRGLFLSALLRSLGFGSMARDRMLSMIAVKEVMTENVVTTTPETLVIAA